MQRLGISSFRREFAARWCGRANIDRLIFSLIVFQNRHISGALAELIRSTRAPTKDRLIGKIMGGNPAFRGTRVPVHLLAELCPRACARARVTEGKCCPRIVIAVTRVPTPSLGFRMNWPHGG